MKKLLLILAIIFVLPITPASAHCEIPCGIYDDGARFTMIMEHAKTIEKSMDQINELSKADDEDYHMITRWTMNKEEHAQKIQDIASQYFLTQRVKAPPVDASDAVKVEYQTHTMFLHKILVAAMKTKQTTDVKNVEALRDLTQAYKAHYFKEHGHMHE